MPSRIRRLLAVLGVLLAALAQPASRAQTATLGGVTFTSKGLVGAGRVDHDKRDKQGETFGSLSGLALDLRTWQRNASGSYTGTLHTQPDRGYVKAGVTTNYRPRRQKFSLTFKPDTNGSSHQDQLDLALTDTVLYAEANGAPLTSLDPTASGAAARTGFPRLPQAFNSGLALDAEGLALLPDGTFFVSDEYGPYLYRFSAGGTLLGAVRPPEALIPKRNAQDSFSSDSPPAGQPHPSPANPDAGRENSQGLEGLAVSADGRTLYALLQSATRQDGGAGGNSQRRHTRLLEYNITNPDAPTLTSEWILPLPVFTVNGNQQVASVGDVVVLSSSSARKQFLVLVRDGNGRGADNTKSNFRAVVVYDTTNATNIAGTAFDNPNTAAAPSGVLAPAITPATSAVLIDINDSAQLGKFGLNNSSNDNSDTLAEKWESLALAPALDPAAPDDFFLFVGNDNDFSTDNGFQDGASFKTSPNIDTMILVYRVTLPDTPAPPIFTTQPSSLAVNAGQTVTFNATAMGTPPPAYQWTRNGVPIPGETTSSLPLTFVQGSDAGAYAVVATNAVGSTTSVTATLTINGANSPVFSIQPASQSIAAGSTVVFSALASNSPSYQWQRNGVPLAGATDRTLVLSRAALSEAGTYTVTATNPLGAAVSRAAVLTVSNTAAADVGRLANLSILTPLTAGETLTMGTVLGGAGTSGAKPLLARAAGPSLAQFGVTGFAPDPTMTLTNTSAGSIVATNNDWGGATALTSTFSQAGAFPYSAATSKDAAIFQPSLPPANFTVQVSDVTGAAGTVIAELYDATAAAAFTTTTPRLINVSVLKVIPGATILTTGFFIGGTTAKTVLIRAIGPRLALDPFGLTDAMADPKLDLFSGQTVIASNDNWGGDAQLTRVGTSVGAFGVADAASRDAMLLITLAPGSYTVQASGVNNTGGRAIVEVYEVP